MLVTIRAGLTFFTVSIVLQSVSFLSVAHATEPETNGKKSVTVLIDLLGSSKFQDREAATRELETRDDAAPLVRAATTSQNSEVRTRAAKILLALDARMFDRALNAGKHGCIDWLTEVVGDVDRQDTTGAAWKTAIEVNKEITRLIPLGHAKPRGVLSSHALKETPSGMPMILGLQVVTKRNCVIREPSALLLRTDSLTATANEGISSSALFVTGNIQGRRISTSTVFCNGSVVMTGTLGGGILICDGDVTCKDFSRSVVIARGNIKSTDASVDCVLIAGGRVISHPDALRMKTDTIKENDHFPLNFVHFFETADAGIEVTASTGSVAVAKLADGQPPAKAGLKVGDEITAVDGKPAKDPETFRRLLRRGTVMDQTVFTVKRGGKDVPVTASFLGWEPPALKPAK